MNLKVIYKFKGNICDDVYICETGFEIAVRHWACPTNLAQHLIEKQFLWLNVWTMSMENLLVVKPSWLN